MEKENDTLPILKYSFKLSQEQTEASEFLVKQYCLKKNSLLHAVCGSGKTEILFELIYKVILLKKRVGFAIPRTDVVIELFPRIKKAFLNTSIKAVYGGHIDLSNTLITILTTHQLHRFKKHFDLLIIDEVDAFPFYGNLDLIKSALNSSTYFVLMTATPPSDLYSYFKNLDLQYYFLNKRFHHQLIPVPKLITIFKPLVLPSIIKRTFKSIKQNRQVLIYVPTIKIGYEIYAYLKLFIKQFAYVTSLNENRKEIISKFKKKEYRVLLTTIILERGITIKALDVIVYQADHDYFKKENLIQIAGRVGRDKIYHTGEILFYGKENTAISETIKEINRANKSQ